MCSKDQGTSVANFDLVLFLILFSLEKLHLAGTSVCIGFGLSHLNLKKKNRLKPSHYLSNFVTEGGALSELYSLVKSINCQSVFRVKSAEN